MIQECINQACLMSYHNKRVRPQANAINGYPKQQAWQNPLVRQSRHQARMGYEARAALTSLYNKLARAPVSQVVAGERTKISPLINAGILIADVGFSN